MGTTWWRGGRPQWAKRRQPSRTRRWLSRQGLWMPALPWKEGRGSPRSGEDSRAGHGALSGHGENVSSPWTDQVVAWGSPVTVDRGQPSRPGARRLPGPSAVPMPLCWPLPSGLPLHVCGCQLGCPSRSPSRPPSSADFSQVLSHMVPVKLHIFPCRLKRHTFVFARQFADCSVGSISYWISQKT